MEYYYKHFYTLLPWPLFICAYSLVALLFLGNPYEESGGLGIFITGTSNLSIHFEYLSFVLALALSNRSVLVTTPKSYKIVDYYLVC